MVYNITTVFNHLKETPSDINEHLQRLSDISAECSHITEMGVRYCVSTWAFLHGLLTRGGGKLISIDIVNPEEFGVSTEAIRECAKESNVDFEFIKGDTTEIEIGETEFLFIDTDHYYNQLKEELKLHGNKATKYLGFHDTVSCAEELIPAIDEFLEENKHWKILEHNRQNNGVMILKRYEYTTE